MGMLEGVEICEPVEMGIAAVTLKMSLPDAKAGVRQGILREGYQMKVLIWGRG